MTVKLPIPVLIIVAMALAVAFVPLPNLPWLPVGPPSPVTDKGFKVLIVEAEPSQRHKLLKPGQEEAMLSTAAGSLREFVASKGGEFRLLDDNNDVSRDALWVQEAWKAKEPPYPWMLVAKDGKASVGPLPETAAESLKIAQKYGGGQ